MPYGFLSDDKWWEDILHIGVGLVPFWGWSREHQQDPPGDPLYVVDARNYTDRASACLRAFEIGSNTKTYYPADRCDDRMRDFLGYSLGSALRTVALIVWAVM